MFLSLRILFYSRVYVPSHSGLGTYLFGPEPRLVHIFTVTTWRFPVQYGNRPVVETRIVHRLELDN